MSEQLVFQQSLAVRTPEVVNLKENFRLKEHSHHTSGHAITLRSAQWMVGSVWRAPYVVRLSVSRLFVGLAQAGGQGME